MGSKRPAPPIEGMTSLKVSLWSKLLTFPCLGSLVLLQVDNLSYRTGSEELRRLFDRYGEIGDIHIPRDRFTRQSKGFAFVR